MNDNEIKDLEKKLDESWAIKHSFAALKKLMDTEPGIEYITSGSARLVYKVSETKVLKIAKNQKGIAQNDTEADWGIKQEGCAADWYNVSNARDEAIWIESEYCKKLNMSVFKEKEGMSFKDYCAALEYAYYENHPSRYYRPSRPANYDELWENDDTLLNKVYMYMCDFDVPIGDLRRINSYGLNQNDEIVLVDTGLNNDVYNEYYKRNESIKEIETMEKFSETLSQQEAGKAKRKCTDAIEDLWQEYDYLNDDIKANSAEWENYKKKVISKLEEYVSNIEDVYGGDEGSESRYHEDEALHILGIVHHINKSGHGASKLRVNQILGQKEEKNLGSDWYVLEHEKHYITKEIKPAPEVAIGEKLNWTNVIVEYYTTDIGEKYLAMNDIYKNANS